MNKIFTILFAAISFFFGVEMATSVLESFDGDSYLVANYLQQNVNVLNYVDKELGFDGDITAIDRVQEIEIRDLTDTFVGYLCDFRGDEGYMLLADDYVVYDYVRGETSPFENVYAEKFFYDTSTGYFYLTAEGNYLSTVEENNDLDGCETVESGGRGFIQSVEYNEYLRKNYPSYNLRIGLKLPYTPSYCQYSLSSYRDEHMNPVEENCGVVASFHCFQAMKYSGKLPNFPSNYEMKTYNIWDLEREVFIWNVDFLGRDGVDWCGKVTWPKLYGDIRGYCHDHYYQISYLTDVRLELMMERIAKSYDTDVNVVFTSEWVGCNQEVIYQIYEKLPSMFRIYVNGLGDHMMCLFGFSTYEKTQKILFLTIKKTATFYCVYDDYGAKSYIDITNYSGNGSLGFIYLEKPGWF